MSETDDISIGDRLARLESAVFPNGAVYEARIERMARAMAGMDGYGLSYDTISQFMRRRYILRARAAEAAR